MHANTNSRQTAAGQITAPQPAPGLPDTFATCIAAFITFHGLTEDQVAYLGLPASLEAEVEAVRGRLIQLIDHSDPAVSGPASPAGVWELGWRAGLAGDPDFDFAAARLRVEALAASTPRALPVAVLQAAWEDGFKHGKRRSVRS